MSRTPEQKAADEALTAAIEAHVKAYVDDGHGWVMSEYVVVLSQHRYDENGDGHTGVGIAYRDGDVPVHRALGLVEYAATRMRALITSDDEDE